MNNEPALVEKLTALIQPLCVEDTLPAKFLSGILVSHGLGMNWRVYDRAHDANTLDQLDLALKQVDRLLSRGLTEAARDDLNRRLISGEYQELLENDNAATKGRYCRTRAEAEPFPFPFEVRRRA